MTEAGLCVRELERLAPVDNLLGRPLSGLSGEFWWVAKAMMDLGQRKVKLVDQNPWVMSRQSD
jgi:hypothetical protein